MHILHKNSILVYQAHRVQEAYIHNIAMGTEEGPGMKFMSSKKNNKISNFSEQVSNRELSE